MEKLEQQFPIVGAVACPVCGSSNRIAGEFINHLKQQGRLRQEAYPDGIMLPVPLTETLFSALSPNPTIPSLLVCFDICGECSTIYCTRVVLGQLPVQMRPKGQPLPPLGLR